MTIVYVHWKENDIGRHPVSEVKLKYQEPIKEWYYFRISSGDK